MINVSESKLSIKKLNFDRGDSVISGIDKEKLKYQKVLLTRPDSSFSMVLPAETTINIPAVCKRAGYSEAWVIEKSDIKHGKEKYTGIEKDVMLKWLKVLFPAHLDTAEVLVRAIDYGNVIRKFYESYGTDLIREFYRLIDSIIDGIEKGTGKSEKKFAKQYISPKYNVLQFLHDIIEAGDVMIYTDPDLIGQYKRISRKLKFSGTIVPDKWCKVIGIVGNRTRANLSLSYETKISVDVPENTFGVEPGARELKTKRSFCFVKDGVVWQKWLGVKTRNKTLIRKMLNSGIVKSGIVYSDEYLVNLEMMPAINKNDIRFISSSRLARSEADIELCKIAGAWARRKEYMAKKSLTVCPKLPQPVLGDAEKFLHSLGIFGDTYVPPKTEVDGSRKSYEAYEVVGHVVGISDPATIATRFINKIGTVPGAIENYLKKLEENHTLSGRSWDEEIAYWEKQTQKNVITLRDLKYKFILGKSMKFCDNRRTKVENVRVQVPIGDKTLTVFWTMDKNIVEI